MLSEKYSTGFYAPLRKRLTNDGIADLADFVIRTETVIAEGGKRGVALDAVARRHGLFVATRMNWDADVAWRRVEMPYGTGGGRDFLEGEILRVVSNKNAIN